MERITPSFASEFQEGVRQIVELIKVVSRPLVGRVRQWQDRESF